MWFLQSVLVFFLMPPAFFGVVGRSVDRFLAIRLHLRYCDSQACCCCGEFSIWLLSVLCPWLVSWVSRDILLAIELSVGGFCLLTTVFYNGICLAVRRHKIIQFQVQEMAKLANLLNLRLVHSTSVYLVFLIVICLTIAAFEINSPIITWKRFSLFSWTHVYHNSSLNPVIHCWKMTHIVAIIDILRNMSRFRNSSSH